jgi:hypothetical protein
MNFVSFGGIFTAGRIKLAVTAEKTGQMGPIKRDGDG